MDHSQSEYRQSDAPNERGAALVISLIVATVLLAAGGALIQVTSMSAANAIDSTAEAQAYYAAEAGIQAALNVFRGNTTLTSTNMPAGMIGINFRNAVVPGRSNDCPNGVGGDPSTVARLSRWLAYSDRRAVNTRVSLGTNPTSSYDVVVSIPTGDPAIASLSAGAEPKRLLVRATGYGPKNARKQISMIISRDGPPAMMTLIGAPSGSPAMNFESGNNQKHYSGDDYTTGSPSGLPAFATTNAADAAIASTQAAESTTTAPAVGILNTSNIPSYLRSPAKTRAFLDEMKEAARTGSLESPATATYLPTGGSGTATGFTFVQGDYTLNGGSGLLIVTGELTTNGLTNFDGVIMVFGAGEVNRNGGGGGLFIGATLVAKVDWPAESPALTDFGAPFFNFNGGGSSNMQYDAAAIARAFQYLPVPIVMGVSEN